MNSTQQQSEHHHWKVPIESFHLSGHTFRFRWTVHDVGVFLIWSISPLAVEGFIGKIKFMRISSRHFFSHRVRDFVRGFPTLFGDFRKPTRDCT